MNAMTSHETGVVLGIEIVNGADVGVINGVGDLP